MNPELKEQMRHSQEVYGFRKNGYTEKSNGSELWSASTRCKVCRDWWLYGVKDNLDFTCPKCTTV